MCGDHHGVYYHSTHGIVSWQADGCGRGATTGALAGGGSVVCPWRSRCPPQHRAMFVHRMTKSRLPHSRKPRRRLRIAEVSKSRTCWCGFYVLLSLSISVFVMRRCSYTSFILAAHFGVADPRVWSGLPSDVVGLTIGWHDRSWTISISNLSQLLTVTSNNFISPCRYIQLNCSYKIS